MKRHLTRRHFLELSGSAVLSSGILPANALSRSAAHSASLTALQRAVERLLGQHAQQMRLRLTQAEGAERFRISGSSGRILIHGSSSSAVMMGVNWYLKYVAGVSISWNGDCLNQLLAILPAPPAPIEQTAVVRHRFALNDTNDGYTGPYWTWEQWERLIDILALHGLNEVLVYAGAEAVYQHTFRSFHYTSDEMPLRDRCSCH